MPTDASSTPSLNDEWQVEMLRMTGFTTAPVPDETVEWWKTVVGESPQSTQIERKEWIRTERGQCCGGVLINSVQPSRVDWAFVSGEDEASPSRFQTFGSLAELTPSFLTLMHRWLDMDTCPELRRLAFGAVVLLPVEGQVAGYRQIARYLPSLSVDPDNSSDLLYRINRPRKLQTDGKELTINRLSTWSVLTFNRLFATIPSLGGPQLEFKKQQMGFACRLEMDINNRADQDTRLTSKATHALLDQLVAFGFEIATKGELP